MAAEWKNLNDGSFKGFTFAVAVPQKNKGHGVISRETVHERKLQIVDRPLTDGSDTNDFGRKGRVHSAEIIFHGTNYRADFESFLKLCDEGTPGVLSLPDKPSVMASYQRMSERAEHGGSNSLTCHVTWVESTQTQSVFASSGPKTIVVPDVTATANLSKSFAQSAIDAVNSNPVLAAIRSAETGLSQVRSVVNAVTSLAEGVRNRIAAIDAEVRGTLSQIKDAVDEISTLFGVSPGGQGVVFAAAIDVVTGQRTGNFSEPDQVTPAPDPLVATRNPPTTSVQLGAILSPSAALVAIDKLSQHLASSRDDLTSNTSGRTDEVQKALTAVVGGLSDLRAVIAATPTHQVVVPAEMSLMEILFANGRSVDEVDTVYGQNRHITDPLVVQATTVITL